MWGEAERTLEPEAASFGGESSLPSLSLIRLLDSTVLPWGRHVVSRTRHRRVASRL